MVLESQPTQINPYQPFTAEHNMFRKAVRAFVENKLNPHADVWEAAGGFPAHQVLKQMGDLGFLGLNYSEEYGGANADIWFTVVLMEELGRCDCAGVPMGISVHTDMSTPALAKYGSHDLKKRYLEPAIKGEMVGAIAVTEPGAGSDVAGIITRADDGGADYIINGSKMYITNGTQADWVCLLARTTPGTGYKGMSLIMVPTDTPGFIVSKKLHKLGNHSSDTAVLTFEDLRVPKSNCIGVEGMGFYMQMEQFQRERLAREVGDTCLQFHGGMGYMEETPISRYFRDARLLSIGGGADEVMLGIIAKLEDMLPPRRKD